MAMTKADMESHRAEYVALMADARSAEREGLYTRSVELALRSWDHIDGMMQYERKHNKKEFASIQAVDMVLKYAPLVFDTHSLDKLEALLKARRRIDKNTSESLADKLSNARALMWEAHRLWDHVERNPGTRQDKLRRVLGGEQEQWRSFANTWEAMGLVSRTPEGGSYRLALSTRMGGVVSAKCPSCGSVANAPKGMFLEDTACPECRDTVLFVILPTKPPTDTKE
ncbi:hypothetical protein LCGC14_1619070 [marine sediment metagenome]|uniref:Uncharacterized protein n=1 Tax=marine sediment metagenome TaxID=412755 RepID=A0A0F9L609_9ZZZZ